MNEVCRQPPRSLQPPGASTSSHASRHSGRTGPCSKAISRPTSSPAATPNCGTPSSASPPAHRLPTNQLSTPAPPPAFTACKTPPPLKRGNTAGGAFERPPPPLHVDSHCPIYSLH